MTLFRRAVRDTINRIRDLGVPVDDYMNDLIVKACERGETILVMPGADSDGQVEWMVWFVGWELDNNPSQASDGDSGCEE